MLNMNEQGRGIETKLKAVLGSREQDFFNAHNWLSFVRRVLGRLRVDIYNYLKNILCIVVMKNCGR